jgi:sugar lactone lactonase YvrE
MLRRFQSFFPCKVGIGNARFFRVSTLTFVAALAVAALPQGVAAQTSVGSANIGSSISCTAVTITFNAAGTLTAINVMTGGAANLDFTNAGSACTQQVELKKAKPLATTGTVSSLCALNGAYNAGDSCTVDVNFTPKFAGPRYGAVVLQGTTEGSDPVLGTSYLQGTGIGPQTTFAVPTEVPICASCGIPMPTLKAKSAALPAVASPALVTDLLPGFQSLIDSGWSYPYGIAVDGAGNVYIADGSNATVTKETLQPDGSYTPVLIPGEWGIPVGVAVDGAGNVYVADAGKVAVYKETLQSDGLTYITSAISEWNYPTGVAVDGAGNVYVADANNAAVKKETPNGSGGYAESTVDDTNLETPVGLAVDGSGNVYVTFDSEAGAGVAKETLQAGGTYAVSYIGSGWEYPVGIAVDSNSNVYVADPEQEVVLRETPSDGSYTAVEFGAWDSPYELALDSRGNLYVTEDGDKGCDIGCFNEDVVKGGRRPIKAAAASHRPLAARSFSHRAKADGILLGGTPGPSTIPSVFRLDYADPPQLGFANTYWAATSTDSPQTVLVNDFGNATLTFSALSYPVDFPEGTGVDTDCTLSVQLTASTDCTLTIDFSPFTDPTGPSTLLSENVALTTNALNTPDGDAQPVSVSGTELATQVASITTVTSSANPVFALNPVTFTATVAVESQGDGAGSITVSSAGRARPMTAVAGATGTMNFLDGTTPVCTAVELTSGVASCTTSSLAAGSHSITAVYSGDGNFLSSTSSVLTQVVVDFTINAQASTPTVVPGKSAQFTLTVSPVSPATAFPAAITLAASGLPAGATAVFSPSTITSGAGTTTVTLTIQTVLTEAAAQPATGGAGGHLASRLAPFSLALLLLPLVGRVRKAGKRFSRMLAVLLLLAAGAAALTGLSGCGSGVGFFGPAQQTYTVGVTGTSGALSHTSSVNLTVE